MSQNQLAYVEDIQNGAREIVKLIGQLPSLSISDCMYCSKFGIFFLLIIVYTSRMIPRYSGKRQIVKLATTPRTVFDKTGLLVSNVFAFAVFPAFVIINVVIYQWIIWGGKLYEGKMLTIGYFLHTSTGSLYFIAGGLQFYSPLRQFYPKIHRIIGYVYYVMALITSFGILLLTLKPHSGFPTQIAVATFLPPWIACNYLALRSILAFKDVELHRQLNIVGLATASGIILMRPLVMIIMVVEAPILFGKALAVAVWIAFVWSLFGSLFYVLHTYTLPTLRLKRLQNDGSCASTGYIHCPLQDFIPGMTVYSYKMIDSRTILIKLGERVDKNEADDFDKSGIDKKMAANSEDKIIQDAVADNQKKSKDIGGKKLIEIKRNYTFPINIPPGCHIVLKLGDVLREYTPINNEDELDSNVEILLRLIPNGKFSLLISNLLGLNDATKNIPHGIWIDCNVPCGVYGPLFPLPSKFGYFPQYCVDAKIDENVHSITGSNESSISISISDHNTKAGAGIKHKNESNEMIRRYYSDDNSSDNTIRKTSINPMIILIGAGTGITPFFKVIQAALRNKKDQTNIRLLTLLGKSEQKNDEINFSTYVEAKVDNLKKLSDVDNNQKNRFESMNFETRFSKSMLHSWIYQSTSSVAKKDNNCSGSGAGKQSDNFSMSKTEDTIVWICGPPGFGENTRTILTKKCSSNNRGDNGKSFSFLKEQIFVFGVDDR